MFMANSFIASVFFYAPLLFLSYPPLLNFLLNNLFWYVRVVGFLSVFFWTFSIMRFSKTLSITFGAFGTAGRFGEALGNLGFTSSLTSSLTSSFYFFFFFL